MQRTGTIPENAAKPGADDSAKDFSAEAAEAKARVETALGKPPKTNDPKTATPQILVKKPERPWTILDEIPDDSTHKTTGDASSNAEKDRHADAAFREFVESLWEKTPDGLRLKNTVRPPAARKEPEETLSPFRRLVREILGI